MSVIAMLTLESRVTEVLTVDGATNANVLFDEYKTSVTLSDTTEPVASSTICLHQALTAGAATIDLTAAPGTQGAQDLSGESLVSAYFKAAADNAANVTIAAGGTNGYALFGASGLIVLAPGDAVCLYKPAGGVVIDATHKNISLTGTGTDEVEVSLVLGAQ